MPPQTTALIIFIILGELVHRTTHPASIPTIPTIPIVLVGIEWFRFFFAFSSPLCSFTGNLSQFYLTKAELSGIISLFRYCSASSGFGWVAQYWRIPTYPLHLPPFTLAMTPPSGSESSYSMKSLQPHRLLPNTIISLFSQWVNELTL